jgi:hypothetical protein
VSPRPNNNVLITSITTSRRSGRVESPAKLDRSDDFVIAQFNPQRATQPTSPLRESPLVSFNRAESVCPHRFAPESANIIPRSPHRRPWNQREFENRNAPTSIGDLPDDLFSSEDTVMSPRSISGIVVDDYEDLSDTVELQSAPAPPRVEGKEEDFLSDRSVKSNSSVLIEFLFKEASDELDF